MDRRPRLRSMRQADVAEVCAIETDSFQTPWSPRDFHHCLNIGYECRVLQDRIGRPWFEAGRILAYGVLSLVGRQGHLLNLCVLKTVRQKGLGTYLLAHLLELASDRVDQVSLETRASNDAALRLYRSFGFTGAERVPAYYPGSSQPEDALVLTLTL